MGDRGLRRDGLRGRGVRARRRVQPRGGGGRGGGGGGLLLRVQAALRRPTVQGKCTVSFLPDFVKGDYRDDVQFFWDFYPPSPSPCTYLELIYTTIKFTQPPLLHLLFHYLDSSIPSPSSADIIYGRSLKGYSIYEVHIGRRWGQQ